MKPHDYDTVLVRLSTILSRLYDGEKLSIASLAEEFNVSKRTLQRDFGERLYRFPIEKHGVHYVLSETFVKRGFHDRVISLEEQIVMDVLESISKHVSHRFERATQALFYKLKSGYDNPMYVRLFMENMDEGIETLRLIEEAIHKSLSICFTYKDKTRYAEPYKIANFEGYWYLYAKDCEDGRIKTFYIKAIEGLFVTKEHFVADEKIVLKLSYAINVWFDPNKELYNATLLAKAPIAAYVQRHPISSYQICEMHGTQGDVKIDVPITDDRELLSLIQYWMPHLHIIAPSSLRQKALLSAQAFLDAHAT